MTMLLLDRPFEETALRVSPQLDLRNIGSKVWPIVLSNCRTTDLRLYHITLPSIEGIERLSSVKHLALEWATKVSDISPIFKLERLTTLSIFDFSKLRQLEGIGTLESLCELNLSGSRGALTPKLKLTSIEPVTQLRGLVSFSLTNAQLDDDDITSLVHCKTLKHLSLSNQFERVQVAYLAKHLNSQLMEPLSACRETHIKCESCGSNKSMFTGRRMPILCGLCDEGRFQRHIEEFEQMVHSAGRK